MELRPKVEVKQNEGMGLFKEIFRPHNAREIDIEMKSAEKILDDFLILKKQISLSPSEDTMSIFSADMKAMKLKLNDYRDIARCYTLCMKQLRIMNGGKNDEKVYKLLALFKPLNKIEELLTQIDTSSYVQSNITLRNEVNKYFFVIEDFIGWFLFEITKEGNSVMRVENR